MYEKRMPVLDEEPKHKKKSTAKGQPRSKHKHIYETVLLTRYYHSQNFKTGQPEVRPKTLPTKVCTICGRIDDVDRDESYYVKKVVPGVPFVAYSTELTEKALSLPKWHADDYWDKFAKQVES